MIDRDDYLPVQAIREALAKAAPGEWEGTGLILSWQESDDADHDGDLVAVGEVERREDGELICLLRNNAEALLNALERAQAASEGVDMLVAQAERRGLKQGWDEGERHEFEYLSTYGQFCPNPKNPYA